VHTFTARKLCAALVASAALLALAPLSAAATPATADAGSSAFASYPAGPNQSVKAASTYFDTTQVQQVVDVLAGLHHGPELSQLSVYVATPEEIVATCGAGVVACYLPAQKRMVVSGVDQRVAGVPRDFAIAHEYGHHIANSQGSDGEALVRGTLRWATHEKVCQYTRARKLFPGDQGAHYFDNPEEAFAQSFALLNMPDANVAWQYSPLLRPTRASLAMIRADVTRPWSGPATLGWSGEVDAVPPVALAARPATAGAGARRVGLGVARAIGPKPWVAERRLRAPLDGNVEVTVSAPQGAAYGVVLRDASTRRILARAATGDAGTADFIYPNCGHSALEIEVRSLQGGGPFTAKIVKP
jgi:hypothetical protein